MHRPAGLDLFQGSFYLNVSIHTRPYGRVIAQYQDIASYANKCTRFNPHPAPRPGDWTSRSPRCPFDLLFQSTPGLMAG
jgi:hypothetical protein